MFQSSHLFCSKPAFWVAGFEYYRCLISPEYALDELLIEIQAIEQDHIGDRALVLVAAVGPDGDFLPKGEVRGGVLRGGRGRLVSFLCSCNAQSCLLKARPLRWNPHEVKHHADIAESRIG